MRESSQGQKRDWAHVVLSNVPMRLLVIPVGFVIVALVYLVTFAFPSLNKTDVALVAAFFLAGLFAIFVGRFSRRS